MQWSSKETRTILSKEVAEESVLEFVPMRFDLGSPEQALNYLSEKRRGSDFRMNDAIRIQTGIDEVEKVSEEKKVEAAALEKLKDIQESAYQEAYQLGMEEGRKLVFQEQSIEIEAKLNTLEETLSSLKNAKKDLLAFNETSLMTLVFAMANRLAKSSLQENPEGMVEILRDAVALAHDEENINVQISPDQYEFLELLKAETGREFEFLKKVNLEKNPQITSGGCIVETNYGEIDARYEQRVEQMWTSLKESLPKVKDKVAG